jgi:hypothetical protein
LRDPVVGVSLPSTEDGNIHVRFEVFTTVTVKNAVFWDVWLM